MSAYQIISQRIKILGFALLLLVMACEKVSDDPVFDLAPKIELVSISNDTLVEFADRLVLELKYEDGDGDLGNPDPDINSIFVRDSRLTNPDGYYLGPLAPEGAAVSIQGTINLELSSTFLLGNGNEEITVYTIYVVDQAGNQSNSVETASITIIR